MKMQIGAKMAMPLGEIVTVPTETVEGFAVRLEDRSGIEELMRVKARDFNSAKIFTLVPENKAAISKYALVSDLAKELIEEYVPGEITLVLPKNPDFHNFYYDHFETIGVRIPDHPLFPELLAKNGALILTSANEPGEKPLSETGHLPSTVVDLTGEKPKILRQGNLKLDF